MNEHSGLIELSAGGQEVERKEGVNMLQLAREMATEHPVIAALLIIAFALSTPTALAYVGGRAAVEATVAEHSGILHNHNERLVKIEAQQVKYADDMTEIKIHMREQSTHMQHVLRALESK